MRTEEWWRGLRFRVQDVGGSILVDSEVITDHSQVDRLSLQYKLVNLGAGKSWAHQTGDPKSE